MNFVQNNFYGTQHPSGLFSKNILHFCQVIKKLSLIIYTLLDWASDYTYTITTCELNIFYKIRHVYFIYKFFKLYLMNKIPQHMVHKNHFHTNYTFFFFFFRIRYWPLIAYTRTGAWCARTTLYRCK